MVRRPWCLAAVLLSVLVIPSAARASLRPCDYWVKATTAGPSPRWGQRMVWDSARSRVILFGGFGPFAGDEAPFDDTWEYDPDTSTWAEISTIGRPPPRFLHAMAYDAKRARVVMFGGQNDPDGGDQEDFQDDLWEYDPATRTWTERTPSGPRPFFLAGMGLAYDPVRQVLVAFGGFSDDGSVEFSTFEWNGSAWSFVDTAHHPDPRAGHAMTYSAAFGGIVMFGGITVTDETFETIFGDAWRYDGSDWTLLPDDRASGRSNHVMTTGPNETDLVVFGGFEVTGDEANTLLRGSPAAAWSTALTTGPPALLDASMVLAESYRRVILFGGSVDGPGDERVATGDTWELRGNPPKLGSIGPAGDTRVTPCSTAYIAAPSLDGPDGGPVTYRWRRFREGQWEPLPDHGHVTGTGTSILKFDPFRADDVGLYDVSVANACGSTESSESGASYRMTLADGHWVPGKFLPAPRDGFAMGYDTDRQTMVIHGGHTQNIDFSYAFYTGTWESVAGGNWEYADDPGPSARAYHAMAYDPERHRMVMFGGHWQDQPTGMPGTIPNETYAETWEYDGTTWTQKFPAQNPGARSRHGMAWDPVRKRVVLFGGRTTGGFVATPAMWEWDGTNWTLRQGIGDPTIGPSGAPLDFPPGRDQMGFAFDTKRGALMVHGGSFYLGLGQTENIKHGDTWEQIGLQWKRRSVLTDYARATGGEHRAMAYDAKHDAMLLFTNSQSSLGDELGILWQWNPTAATWDSKPRVPIYREKAAMTYDAGRERVVVAGGFRGCYAVGPGGLKICNLDDTWEWEFFDFDPTCGVDACGDGYVDSSEQCDGTAQQDCCTGECQFRPVPATCPEICAGGVCEADGDCNCPSPCGNGVIDAGEDCDPGGSSSFCCNTNCTFAVGAECNAICPGDGVCIANGFCQCLPVCGDGVVEGSEDCDPPGTCCTPKCRHEPPGGACGDVCRGDVCIVPPVGASICGVGSENATGCGAGTSATGFVDGATGGTLSTPDGMVTVAVAAGSFPREGTYGIASGLTNSAFGVGTAATRVLTARLMPEGATFVPPGVTLTMRWRDDDANYIVDGTTVNELDLRVYKDGVPLTLACGAMPICPALANDCCDQLSNLIQVRIFSFSEVVLVAGAPCAAATAAKLSLSKMLPPAGDDGLAFAGVLPAPSTPPDPDLAGLGIVVNDADHALVNVTLPPGAYDKTTKTGWKVDKKRTKWTWSAPKGGAYGGIVKVTLALNAKKGELKVGVKGAGGNYAATPPATLALRFPANDGCARAALAEGGRSCAVKGKGKSLVCK